MIVVSPIGKLGIKIYHEKLHGLCFEESIDASMRCTIAKSQLARELQQQLQEYFAGQRKKFDLAYEVTGTPFQCKVWKAMEEIPYGQTRTYQELADQLQSSPRAVGNACRANPIAVVIPCHRVVSKKGIGGFAGKTEGRLLQVKRQLLELEGVL